MFARPLFLLLLLVPLSGSAGVSNLVIDDRNVFPESLSSTPDGTLYIGSNLGRIYRARPGEGYAEPWLDPHEAGLHPGLRGVLTEPMRNTLWVCDDFGKESALV